MNREHQTWTREHQPGAREYPTGTSARQTGRGKPGGTRFSAGLALAAAWLLILQPCTAANQQPHGSQADAPANHTAMAGVEALFTPEDDATARIVAAIGAARESIRVQAYLFTSRKLANALIRAHRAGVTVAVIVDREQLEKGGAPSIADLLHAGVPVHVDGQHVAAHNKIILIDAAAKAPVVISGSYNFTVAAQTKNAENVLIIHGDRRLAAAYDAHWQLHRAHSVPVQ